MTHPHRFAPRRLSRRVFLADLGRGGAAALVVGTGLVACSTDDEAAATAAATSAEAATTASTAAATAAVEDSMAAPSAPAGGASESTGGATSLQRVSLGFVSAYVLARGGEAAMVDTGVSGSTDDLEAGLAALGLGWEALGHVIVTHSHGDHMGSLAGVMDLAPLATAYGGAADVPSMTAPRAIEVVSDGDRVFDLQIIETPGHTLGHVSVLDAAGGLLLAGDALNGVDGGVVGANPQFSADLELANASVVKLAALGFETVVFGHGEPVDGGASALVAALAAQL